MLAFLASLLLFLLVSTITELFYYSTSECASPRPQFIPISRINIDSPEAKYISQGFFPYVGLLTIITLTVFIAFLLYKDVTSTFVPEYVQGTFLEILFKPFLVASLTIGIFPSLLMPIYVYDYYLCTPRSGVFKPATAIYFSETWVMLLLVDLFMLSAVIWLFHKFKRIAAAQNGTIAIKS